jgi:hypothetical protein
LKPLNFILPCGPYTCDCVGSASHPTTVIYGKLTYEVGYDLMHENVEIVVPEGAEDFVVFSAFENICTAYVLAQGGHSGCICFRSDGSQQIMKSMSPGEWMKNTRYKLTGRGVPVVREYKFFQRSNSIGDYV